MFHLGVEPRDKQRVSALTSIGPSFTGNSSWLGQSSRERVPVPPQETEGTTTGDFIGHDDPISGEKYSHIAPKKRATQGILWKSEDQFERYEIVTCRKFISRTRSRVLLLKEKPPLSCPLPYTPPLSPSPCASISPPPVPLLYFHPSSPSLPLPFLYLSPLPPPLYLSGERYDFT